MYNVRRSVDAYAHTGLLKKAIATVVALAIVYVMASADLAAPRTPDGTSNWETNQKQGLCLIASRLPMSFGQLCLTERREESTPLLVLAPSFDWSPYPNNARAKLGGIGKAIGLEMARATGDRIIHRHFDIIKENPPYAD